VILLRFKRAGPIEISDEVEGLLRQYRQREGQNEMGGVLVGWQRDVDDTFVVCDMSLPSCEHKAGKMWFQLNPIFAQSYLDRVFKASSGVICYCGFWHTHPEENPIRSRPDRKVLSDLFCNGKLNFSWQLGLIIGDTGKIYSWCQYEDGTCEQAVCIHNSKAGNSPAINRSTSAIQLSFENFSRFLWGKSRKKPE